jgi:hypothetical protein
VGDWEGSGEGGFPTMPAFRYRERLTVSPAPDDPVLHYLQRTWRQDDAGEVRSHRETGFLGLGSAGTVTLTSSQGTDRVEALTGSVTVIGRRVMLTLESVVIGLDRRVLRSWRDLTIESGVLVYRMGMATTAVPDGQQHLSASLRRR